MNTSINSGYVNTNEISIDKKYFCPSCSQLFKDPVQLLCGHRLCRTCISTRNTSIQCTLCNEKTLSPEVKIDAGFRNEMQKLMIKCTNCSWFGHLKDLQNHLELAHHQLICPFCNEMFNSSISFEQHKEKLCLKAPTKCALEQYGCNKQMTRGDLEQHYLTEKHQQVLVSCAKRHHLQIIKQQPSYEIMSIQRKIEKLDPPSKITTTSAVTMISDRHDDEGESIDEILDIFSNSTNILSDDQVRLKDETLKQTQLLEAANNTLSTLVVSNEESNSLLDAIKINSMIQKQKLLTIKETCEDQQVASYDGTLIWKISQFQEKMIDAKSERQVSIYSPPFYSSPTGYKMCARLYLQGDGNARHTHMSIFFVLMRSNYDPVLQFPFNYKVTFCLYNQSDRQSHVIESFRPDTRSSSFQRPRSNMNIASGIPKFVELSMIEKPDTPYVKDDVMFIKAIIEFEKIPKAILPYALSLNPGLPTNIQRKMIQQEIKRNATQSEMLT